MRKISEDKEHQYKYYSAWYLTKFTKTKSLAKLEELVKLQGEERTSFVASAYIFYNKMHLLNKFKYPTLYKHVEKFKKWKGSKEYNDYAKVQVVLEQKINETKRDERVKNELRDYINDFLTESNTSINALSTSTKVKYSNLYNFLKKKEQQRISIDKLYEIKEVINEKWNN